MLDKLWQDIPTGKNNAITYTELCSLWQCTERTAREHLHELSLYDNGDDYILIRSSKGKGFYKTDDENEIKAYKKECLNKGRSIFAPVKKINRVLNVNAEQYSLSNNLRVIRESREMKQGEVCKIMKKHYRAFDKSILSKIENSVILPTPHQLLLLSQIYGVEPSELLTVDFILLNYKNA